MSILTTLWHYHQSLYRQRKLSSSYRIWTFLFCFRILSFSHQKWAWSTKQSKPFPLASRLQCAWAVRVENGKLEPTGMCMLAKKRLPMSTSGAKLWVLQKMKKDIKQEHCQNQNNKPYKKTLNKNISTSKKNPKQKHCKSTHEEASWLWSKPWMLALSLAQGWGEKRNGSMTLVLLWVFGLVFVSVGIEGLEMQPTSWSSCHADVSCEQLSRGESLASSLRSLKCHMKTRIQSDFALTELRPSLNLYYLRNLFLCRYGIS